MDEQGKKREPGVTTVPPTVVLPEPVKDDGEARGGRGERNFWGEASIACGAVSWLLVFLSPAAVLLAAIGLAVGLAGLTCPNRRQAITGTIVCCALLAVYVPIWWLASR